MPYFFLVEAIIARTGHNKRYILTYTTVCCNCLNDFHRIFFHWRYELSCVIHFSLPFALMTAIHKLLDIRQNVINIFIILETEVSSSQRVIQFDGQYHYTSTKVKRYSSQHHAPEGYPHVTSYAKHMKSGGRVCPLGSRGNIGLLNVLRECNCWNVNCLYAKTVPLTFKFTALRYWCHYLHYL